MVAEPSRSDTDGTGSCRHRQAQTYRHANPLISLGIGQAVLYTHDLSCIEPWSGLYPCYAKPVVTHVRHLTQDRPRNRYQPVT